MLGTLLNAVGILLGGLAGANPRWQLSASRQSFLKAALGVFTFYAGARLVWMGWTGGFLHGLAQFGIVLLAMSAGKILGGLLGLQKLSNAVGQFAKDRLNGPAPPQSRGSDGFTVCAGLFCAAPLAIYGALQEGLQNNWHLLAIKAVMDGLAAMAFVPLFGRMVLLSVLPVVAWQGLLTLGARVLVEFSLIPVPSHPLDSLNMTCGVLAFGVALVVFEVKKIELADYLPSLALAPLLTAWWL